MTVDFYVQNSGKPGHMTRKLKTIGGQLSAVNNRENSRYYVWCEF